MASNVCNHGIRYGALTRRGFLAGVLSSIVMGVVAMSLSPIVGQGTDFWTFPKVVSTIALGSGAATPLMGFAAGPVLVGLGLHLLIGGIAGAVFAWLVGMFDVEEPAPIMVAGMIYGAAVFLTAYIAIGRTLLTHFDQLPVIVMFWAHVAFGVFAGFLLGRWQEQWDSGAVETTTHFAPRLDPETAALSAVGALAIVAVVLAMLAVNPIAAIAVVFAVLVIFGAGAWQLRGSRTAPAVPPRAPGA